MSISRHVIEDLLPVYLSGVQWAWADFPAVAVIAAIVGLGFWVAYARLRYQLRTQLFK